MIKFGLLLFVAYVSTTSALPSCICTLDYRPVCGSDGNTYPNECALNCRRAEDPNLSLRSKGACAEPCGPCPMIYSPVCGTDGQTYPNDCVLDCKKKTTPTLEIKSRGECQKETVKVAELPSCVCRRNMEPVCGTDGVTYSNPCMLNCAKSLKGEDLQVAHEGNCEIPKTETESPRPIPSCTCTKQMQPVCGADNVTYANNCMLECHGQEKKKDGPC